MPTYELTLIMKKMARPSLVESLKRVGSHIYDEGGYIRKVESLGDRRLPNVKRANEENHREGHYFTMEVDLKTTKLDKLLDIYKRDKDVVQRAFLNKTEPVLACPGTLNEELLPPAERPSIQALIQQGRKPPRFRKIFQSKTGLDFYPFHR